MKQDSHKHLILVLEDQLNVDLSALQRFPHSPVVLIESKRAFSQFPYHKKRITFLVSAMRHFAEELRSLGRDVYYYPLRANDYKDSISGVRECLKITKAETLVVTQPNDYHTREWIGTLSSKLGVAVEICPSNLFLTDLEDFKRWVTSIRSPLMETFYRSMRKRYKILLDKNGGPEGGKWNYDSENRKSFKAGVRIPGTRKVNPDEITLAAMQDVAREFSSHPGDVEDFNLPVTRVEARSWLKHFIDHKLDLYGDYQDALVAEHSTLFHSLIGPLLNAGLLTPLECIEAAERAYHKRGAPLNSVEGFIRQILGWREYIYGMYQTFMPEYRTRNHWGFSRDLPEFFWTGKTELNCLRITINDLLKTSYSHHIQRLMIICNFATLAGINPQQVNDWFLSMYIDSHDWVVTPNVIGMGMNADGNFLATKPYISSASYVNRMSNYCNGCSYSPKERNGDKACPFNFLFWHFLDEHKAELDRNPRMKMMLKNLERIPQDELVSIKKRSKRFLEQELKV